MATTEQKLAAAQAQVARLRARVSDERRRADAHQKIALGGLVIAAGVDAWDPAEIVGALLAVAQRDTPEVRATLREAGIARLQARASAR